MEIYIVWNRGQVFLSSSTWEQVEYYMETWKLQSCFAWLVRVPAEKWMCFHLIHLQVFHVLIDFELFSQTHPSSVLSLNNDCFHLKIGTYIDFGIYSIKSRYLPILIKLCWRQHTLNCCLLPTQTYFLPLGFPFDRMQHRLRTKTLQAAFKMKFPLDLATFFTFLRSFNKIDDKQTFC